MLAAVLAVAGIWSGGHGPAYLWRIPAALLLLGLALEGYFARVLRPRAHVVTRAPALLGRAQSATFVFENHAGRPLHIEYAPTTPRTFACDAAARRVQLPARGQAADTLEVLPVGLGVDAWPAIPVRVRGPLALAWWGAELASPGAFAVAPDILRGAARARGLGPGARARRAIGAGHELYQLRDYVRGDPLTRIDWKATARSGALVAREFSEDQHLDVLVAIDAGRLSRVRAGPIDRLGLYSNVAASFAEVVVENEDRIGLMVYAERVLASCAPARGLPAVARLRHTLAGLAQQSAESAPTAAAVSMRRLLRQRSLVVILTDLDDASVADLLARAVRLLSPPHLVLIAGVHGGEIAALAQREARSWQDPWIALAATAHERRAAGQRRLLERLGAPVVAASAERLQDALFARYEELRRRRRV